MTTHERGAGEGSTRPAEVAREILAGILERMGFDASVEAVEEEGGTQVRLEVVGEDAPLVAGQRGAVLDAFELIVSRALLKRVGPGARISVDADGYRGRREASLVDLARRLANEARESGQIVALNPMSPRDRRIVHMALRDEAGISTRSEGEEPERRLLIVPEG